MITITVITALIYFPLYSVIVAISFPPASVYLGLYLSDDFISSFVEKAADPKSVLPPVLTLFPDVISG